MENNKGNSEKYIAEFLKQHDPERYYSTLLLNQDARFPVQTLYAFSAEISRIRSLISEPATGEIRLQYWVDLLSGTDHGDRQQNPLASALLETIKRFDLPKTTLLRLLAARRFDLYDDPMRDLISFEGYAGETNSMLYQLASIIVNKGEDAGAGEAAGHMGVAHAMIGHFRALPTTLARGQIYFPVSIFLAHGATENEVLAKVSNPQVIAGYTSLREIAHEHLANAQVAINSLPPEIRPVFALFPVLDWNLQLLNKKAKTPFLPHPDMAAWQKIARMVWWSLRN